MGWNDVYLSNKVPFLDDYGDINLVGHVIKSHEERRKWKKSHCDLNVKLLHFSDFVLTLWIKRKQKLKPHVKNHEHDIVCDGREIYSISSYLPIYLPKN